MNELIQNSFNALTMSSREIAELTGKAHFNVLVDVRKMLSELGEDELKFQGIYRDSMNREQTEYLLDKETCLCLVAGYNAKLRMAIIKRWQQLEQATTQVQVVGKAEDATRAALLLSQHLNIKGPALETFLVTTVENIIGVEIPYRPLIEQRTYSAKELGDVLGISANKVGRIANAHGLKTDEFGMLYLSKSEHGPKQVETWRYYDCAIARFKSILENE